MRKFLCVIALVALSLGAAAEYCWMTPAVTRRGVMAGDPLPPRFASQVVFKMAGIDVHSFRCLNWQARHKETIDGVESVGVGYYWPTPRGCTDFALMYIRFTTPGCYRFVIYFRAGPWEGPGAPAPRLDEVKATLASQRADGSWEWSVVFTPPGLIVTPLGPWLRVEFVYNIRAASPTGGWHYLAWEYRVASTCIFVRAVVEYLGLIGARPDTPHRPGPKIRPPMPMLEVPRIPVE